MPAPAAIPLRGRRVWVFGLGGLEVASATEWSVCVGLRSGLLGRGCGERRGDGRAGGLVLIWRWEWVVVFVDVQADVESAQC